MTEKLLQYIWQFQYFNRASLRTMQGELVEVIHPGKINRGQGPDFLDAKIRIDGVLMAGSVEIHHKTSQWIHHGHQQDPHYNNVILHVVLSHNENATPHIPVLELEQRISMILLERYESLMDSSAFIACSSSIQRINSITWTAWKDRLIAERLTRKASMVFSFLEQNKSHWEETLWWMLARHFGSVTNADAFESVARSLPLNLLARHQHNIVQLEALLMGQAGLLENNFHDHHPRQLLLEYQFLKRKYNLKPVPVPVLFLRMRPGNFPTIRLAQLAALLHHRVHFFPLLLSADDIVEVEKEFQVPVHEYWNTHYKPDVLSANRNKNLGRSMVHNLVINAVVPVLFAYGIHHNEEKYKEKALNWLQKLPPESNSITNGFESLGIANSQALDSQALIELKTKYCDIKRCLSCSIGNTLLRHAGHNTERAFL